MPLQCTEDLEALKKALERIEAIAKHLKTAIQMIIGIIIIGVLAIHLLWGLAQNGKLTVEELTFTPLQIVGVGLIFSTAVELAYLLFTLGPDEAIDPIITGVAAILLLRIPSPTSQEDITFIRITEIAVYGLIITIFFWVRELYLNGEHKRKSEGSITKGTESDKS